MRRILYTCIIVFMTVTNQLEAQIRFTANEWETVLQTAVREHKNVFVDVYTSWCGPCKRMAREVFADTAVGDYMNARFVCIQLDAEREADHPFFRQFKPTAYPTYYWLDANARLLDSQTGYMPADTFLHAAEKALASDKGRQWEEYTRRWNEGERDTTFVETYLFEVLPQFQPDSVRPHLNQFLAGLTDEERRSSAVGRMVMRFTRNLEDDLTLRTLLTCHPDYRQTMTPADVDRALYLVAVRIPMMHFNTDSTRYEADLRILAAQSFPDQNVYARAREAERQLFSTHYAEGIQLAEQLCAEHEADHPSLYSELCYTLIISRFFSPDYTPGKEETEAVMRMARKAFHLAPSQNTLSLLAAAYARMGDYRKAYEAASYLPFYKTPTLSNAVYPLLGITFDRTAE
ncbi:MAG TPA: hypothetical protein DCZ73_03985 [Bacteroides sp.]|nr:hypothetical protein [Bacteroides sp.]